MVGVLSDDTDPMVTVMKLEKAPQETYADIGGKKAEQLLNITLKTMYTIFVSCCKYVDVKASSLNQLSDNLPVIQTDTHMQYKLKYNLF